MVAFVVVVYAICLIPVAHELWLVVKREREDDPIDAELDAMTAAERELLESYERVDLIVEREREALRKEREGS